MQLKYNHADGLALRRNSKSPSIQLRSVLLMLSSLTVMAGATIAPSLPQMAEVFAEIPEVDFLVKLLLTLPALSIAIFAPLMGVLVDKWGRVRVLYPSLVIYALAGSSGFFFNDLYIILAGRVFLGVAVAGIITTVLALVGDYFKGAERNRFIGAQAAFMSLGGAIFVGTGGYLADLQWDYPFLIYLFALILLVLSYFQIYEHPRKVTLNRVEAQYTNQSIYDVLPILFVAFISMVIFYMIPVQLPFYLKSIGIEKNSLTGISIAVSTIASTVTGFLYGRISDRFKFEWIFFIVFLLMGAGFITISVSNSLLLIIVAMLITGFGLGMLMPNLNAWLLNIAGEANRGKFSGYFSAAMFLGQFVSPLVIAPLNELMDLASVFFVAAIVLVLVALIFLIRSLGSVRVSFKK